MDSLTSGIFNLLGAFMLCYLGARAFCCSSAAILSAVITRGSRYAIKHRYSKAPFFHALMFAHLEQLPINVYVSILGYANSRAINLRQTVAALRGAMVGNILFLWVVAFWLHNGSTTIYDALTLSALFLVFALFFFNIQQTRSGSRLLIGFALLALGFSLAQMAASELMISNSGVVTEFMIYTTQGGFFSILMGVIVGAFFSLLFRSPTMSVIVALIISGLYGGNIFLYGMAVGAPLGILFPLAGFAQRANATARRAAVYHSITVLGSSLFSLVLCTLSYKFLGQNFYQLWVIVVIFTLTSLVFPSLVWLVVEPMFGRMVSAIIPYDNVSHRLRVLTNSVKMPPLFVVEIAKQEVVSHARRTYKMLTILLHSLQRSPQDSLRSYQQIDKYHEISRRVEREIADYVLQLGSLRSGSSTSSLVQLVLSQGHTLVEISLLIVRMKDVISGINGSPHPLTNSQIALIDDLFDHLQRCYVRTIGQMTQNGLPTTDETDQDAQPLSELQIQESENTPSKETDSEVLEKKILLASQKHFAYNQYQMMQILESVGQLNQRLLDLNLLEKDIYNVNTEANE